MKSVGILLFDEVEVLDFAGPFEVFSVTGRRSGDTPFQVFTVAQHAHAISARNQLIVTPTYSFVDAPPIHILVVPGGYGTRRVMHDESTLDWVRSRAHAAELVLSVCTGALILGKAGLLDGMPATTHHLAVDELKAAAPLARVDGSRRLIDNGKIVVAAGVSSGIDAAFHVVARLLGDKMAQETARYIEYPLAVAAM
jgi:transcriptional regulator GlxA family with amidase domain